MKELIYPIVASIVVIIVTALASLFSDVGHNTIAIDRFEKNMVIHRNFILNNHNSIIRLQEHNKYIDKEKH